MKMSFWKSVIISAVIGGITGMLLGHTVGNLIAIVLTWYLYDPNRSKSKNKHFAD